MKTAAVLAFAGAVVASPNLQKRQSSSFNLASASLAVFEALPSSLQSLALTNQAAAASEIEAEFATGTPSWFSALPTDVRSYLLAQGSALTSQATALPSSAVVVSTTASAKNSTITSAGHSNSTALITSATVSTASTAKTTTTTKASSASAAASGSSIASSGLAALPTQIVAGGFVGVAGLMAVLAL